MKILFLTLLDFSTIDEKSIYTDLIREFVNDNHEMYIISPTEKRKNLPTKLIDKGNVKILKLQIGNTQKTNIIEKGISMLTLESKFKGGIKKYFNNVKFDLVLYSTPPITLQKSVDYVKNRDNAKSYLLLKDIFPQNAVDLGMLKKEGVKSLIYKYFRNKEEKLYRISDFIGCMSDANKRYILEHNPSIDESIVEICPNTIEPYINNISEDDKVQIRNKYEIPNDKTIFIYGGNLGRPQGIDFLIECISKNESNKDSYILIVGSGTEYPRLMSYFESSMPKNAKLLSHLPKEDYEILANSCDVGLIFLDKRFTIPNYPSRLLSYMHASMPVLAATDINTDIRNLIEDNNIGFWCESSNPEKFNVLVDKLCNRTLRESFGENSRTYLENNYTSKHSYDIIMNHFK